MKKWMKDAWWIVFCAWLILLTVLSSEDGPTTTWTSGWITDIVMRLIRISQAHHDLVEALLRLVAHYVCFFVLGALLYTAMRVTFRRDESVHLWAWGLCGLTGILDEVKKLFIAGRHLSWEEAGLNVIGAWCGIITAMVGSVLLQRRKSNDT